MMDGVDRQAPIVIDIEDKVTALAEPDNIQSLTGCIMRSLKNMIGEVSNYATCYHNRVAASEKTKLEYETYIDLLSVINGKAIDFAKTGVLYPIPRNIASYGRPLPYFMKYISPHYASLKQMSKARSNMNLLCMSVEKWEMQFRYKRKKIGAGSFDWKIMYDEEIGYDQAVFDEIEKIYLEFDAYRKEQILFERQCHNWDLYHAQIEHLISKQEAKVYQTDWRAIYNMYRNRCQLICPDQRELANILVKLNYEKYPKKYTKFIWHMAGRGIVENIKAVPVSLPRRDNDGPHEYLGQRYSLAEPAVATWDDKKRSGRA